jgi:hypothetical protein
MGCRHLEEGYEIYLLGALGRSEQEELHRHVLQGCITCTAELREAAENLYWFLQNVSPVRPSAAMKSRLLQRLTSSSSHAAARKKPRASAFVRRPQAH